GRGERGPRPRRLEGRRPQRPTISRRLDRPPLSSGRQNGLHGGRCHRPHDHPADLYRWRPGGGRRGPHDQSAVRGRHRERHEGRAARRPGRGGGDSGRRHECAAALGVSRPMDGVPRGRSPQVLSTQAGARGAGGPVLQLPRAYGERDPAREADAGPDLCPRAGSAPAADSGGGEILHLTRKWERGTRNEAHPTVPRSAFRVPRSAFREGWMLSIDLRGKRALVAGVADDGGYGFAIAKALAEAGATVCAGTWPPALNIFLNLLERGKIDDSRRMPDG